MEENAAHNNIIKYKPSAICVEVWKVLKEIVFVTLFSELYEYYKCECNVAVSMRL